MVVALERVDTAGLKNIPAVHIETDPGQKTTLIESMAAADAEPSELDVDRLARIADTAGLYDFRTPAAALGKQLRQAASYEITDLIINGLDHEPESAVHHYLLTKQTQRAIDAARYIRKILHPRHTWLAIDRHQRSIIRRCRKLIHKTPVRLALMDNKYPQANARLLTLTITGREIPIGREPQHVRVLAIELQALLALYNAVLRDEACTGRLIPVAGHHIEHPGLYRIPIGTRYSDILRHVGATTRLARVIDGGLLTGRSVEHLDAVTTHETAGVLALDHRHDHLPTPGPCIHCGWCQEDCPVGLDPRMLLDLYEREKYQQALAFYPHACIECGLCGYVCPAELPLTQAAVGLKNLLPMVGHGGGGAQS